jgi:hypothetical protein
LPRGLGDDPLSRQRKKDRDRPVANAAPLNSVVASHDPLSVQPFVRQGLISEALVSSQPSPSYNDVFFQRRLEDNLENVSTISNDIPSPSVAEPVVPPTEMDGATVDMAPDGSPLPQSEGDAARAEASPTLGETLTAPNEDAKKNQPRAEERGFFRRIFGRLGQQKSH